MAQYQNKSIMLALVILAAVAWPGAECEAQVVLNKGKQVAARSIQAPMTLKIRALAQLPGQNPGVIDEDADLYQGTRLAFEVYTSKPAHVYLAQVSADAKQEVTVLFPDPDFPKVNPLTAFAEVVLPAPKAWDWFVIDDRDVGQKETIYVVASQEPLTPQGLRAAILAPERISALEGTRAKFDPRGIKKDKQLRFTVETTAPQAVFGFIFNHIEVPDK